MGNTFAGPDGSSLDDEAAKNVTDTDAVHRRFSRKHSSSAKVRDGVTEIR